MALRAGLVGLPNAGKSTLLNALSQARASTAPYPFTTIDPNRGVASVPDRRLEALARVLRPARVVPATVEVVDIAGLVRGASRGEGLGNQFLAHVREVDVLLHVVRLFAAPEVAHVEGTVDPVRDAEIVEAELLLADLAQVERLRERAGPRARSGDAAARAEVEVLDRLREALARGIPARRALEGEELTRVAPWRLLTAKPVLVVANVDGAAAGAALEALQRHAEARGARVVALDARLEADLAELPAEEAAEFRRALGGDEDASGVGRLLRATYQLLELITFFTVLSQEVRAWPLRRGATALEAAGRIHTDMARGFIRAEVVSWEGLVAAGSLEAARERGLVRAEGRGYVVQDGDVLTIRFAV